MHGNKRRQQKKLHMQNNGGLEMRERIAVPRTGSNTVSTRHGRKENKELNEPKGDFTVH